MRNRVGRIAGTGRYLPARVVTNDALAERLATSDEWIRTRTGIRQRHIAADAEQTSDLALAAARIALQQAGIAAANLDLIIVATTTPGILTAHLHADGHYRSILCVPGQVQRGGVVGSPFVHMDGPGVFKFAVKVLAEVAQEALDATGMPSDAIDWLIPHQANIRIMDATVKKLKLPMERLITTVDMHANTSAASIPLALDVAARDGRIRSGQHVMLLGVGGGFTWGSVFLRWT